MERASLFKPTRLAVDTAAPQGGHPSHHGLESWVRRRLRNIDHEKRVLQIATAFHDMTGDLHGLSRRGSWALQAAALVHDVGRSVDPAMHEHIGAELVLNDARLDLSPSERRALAYLTRYHRGPVPDLGDDGILRPADNHEELLKVLGLLRAADTLDHRGIEPPRLLFLRRHKRLDIQCVVEHRSSRAAKVFCRPKKFKLMEKTLGCAIDVEVRG